MSRNSELSQLGMVVGFIGLMIMAVVWLLRRPKLLAVLVALLAVRAVFLHIADLFGASVP